MWPKYVISWSCTHRGLKCGDQMKVTWHQIMNIFFSLCAATRRQSTFLMKFWMQLLQQKWPLWTSARMYWTKYQRGERDGKCGRKMSVHINCRRTVACSAQNFCATQFVELSVARKSELIGACVLMGEKLNFFALHSWQIFRVFP